MNTEYCFYYSSINSVVRTPCIFSYFPSDETNYDTTIIEHYCIDIRFGTNHCRKTQRLILPVSRPFLFFAAAYELFSDPHADCKIKLFRVSSSGTSDANDILCYACFMYRALEFYQVLNVSTVVVLLLLLVLLLIVYFESFRPPLLWRKACNATGGYVQLSWQKGFGPGSTLGTTLTPPPAQLGTLIPLTRES